MTRQVKALISSIVVLLGFLLFFPGNSTAQTADAGTQPILHEIGASARAFALGRAFVALADDPSAVFWNPSGLEYAPRMALSLFHTPLVIEGASYDFIGFVYPTLQFGTVGVGYARLGVSGISVRDVFNIELSDNASFDFSEIYIAYAKKIPFNLSAGLTFKVQRQDFPAQNRVTSAFGLDAGLMYRPRFESPALQNISVGIHFQNALKQRLKLGAHEDTLGYKISFGVAKGLRLGTNGNLNILLGYTKGEFQSGSIHFGSEYVFNNMASLRAGFDKSFPSFGAGVKYKFVQLDYSFGSLTDETEFPPSHRFSITFNLGMSREEKIELAEKRRIEREKQIIAETRERDRQRRIAEHMKKGKEYLDQERYFDAYSEFQQVLVEDTFNKEANALFDSTRALIDRQFEKQQQEAISHAVNKELAEENRKFVELHFKQGHIFLQNNQFTDALIEFNQALERAPGDSLIQEAIRVTERRLNTEVRKLVTAARDQFKQGNYSEALRLLSEALVLSPKDPQLKEEINTLTTRIKVQQITVTGLAYLELGDYEKAKETFEEGLKLDPANEAMRRYLEIAKGRLGGPKQQEMDPEAQRQYLIGTEHFLAGRYEEALKIWKKLAEKYPYNKELQDAINTAEDRLKRTKENE
ncbi:MAG: tetratricopeptide repeat protein [Calditrichaeota bacterium]|nr:MAG: tetratricopeptide repeat protein [Calditrichota bacterium]